MRYSEEYIVGDLPTCSICKVQPVRAENFVCGRCAAKDSKSRDRKITKKQRMLRAAITAGRRVRYMLRCMNAHLWSVDVDPTQRVAQINDPTCPDCGAESSVQRKLTVTLTNAKCSTVCWRAIDPFRCSCSCGGTWHGSRTGPPEVEAA